MMVTTTTITPELAAAPGSLFCGTCGTGLYFELERQSDGGLEYGRTVRHPAHLDIRHVPVPVKR